MSNALVELHCHILPGIDDGAKDLDMSMSLIRKELCLRGFLLKNFNIQEFVFSSLTLSYGLSRSWLYVSNFGVGFVRVLPCC